MVHVDIFIDHKSLQYMFSIRNLNLRQKWWLELLKDHKLSVFYHMTMANIVIDTLNRMSIGSMGHVEDGKKELVNMFTD